MAERKQGENPYDVCTWRPLSECKDCTIGGRLKCRFSAEDLLRFAGLFLLFVLPAIIGIILGGYVWYLLAWLGLAVVFFGLWEIRILCSHCPYYAERGSVLHCIANYGCPKLWRYRPEPISEPEKTQLVVGFVIMCGYPFPFLILGGQLGLALLTAAGLVVFFWTLHKWTCSKCVNFSCILNRVPKDIVDEYLRRNPVMRKAWEERGWQVGKTA